MVTSVHHMLLDKSNPERGADYFRKINEATVKVHPEEQHVGDFDWLVSQYYMDLVERL